MEDLRQPLLRIKSVKGIQRNLKKIVKLKGSPNQLGIAFALGVFVSFSPFYGIHTPIAIGIAYLFRLNLFATVVGAWVNTPFTAPLVYGACYYIGNLCLGESNSIPINNFSDLNYFVLKSVILQITIGWLLLGTAAALMSHFLIKFGIEYYRKRSSGEPTVSRIELDE